MFYHVLSHHIRTVHVLSQTSFYNQSTKGLHQHIIGPTKFGKPKRINLYVLYTKI